MMILTYRLICEELKHMKVKYLLFISVLLTVVILPTCFCQDNTQVGLPEGAIARLGKGGINIMRFTPDGEHLAVGTQIGVWIYDVQTGKGTPLFIRNSMQFNTLAFSKDGKLLATEGLFGPTIQLWDFNKRSKLSTLQLPQFFGLRKLAFSEDNKKLIGLGFEEIIEWQIGKEQHIFKKQYTHSHPIVAFAKDSKTFVYGHQIEGEISIWDPVRGRLGDVFVFRQKHLSTFEMLLSELFGGNPNDRRIKKGIQAIAISSDNNTVASAHDDNIVRLWDTTTKTEQASLKGHTEKINVIAFSVDSTMLASGGEDRKILLWDVRKGRRRKTLIRHQGRINTLAFSPVDNRLLASGSSDGTVRFWDTKTGKERSILTTGHPKSVKTVAFNTDNSLLYSAVSNGTVHIWDIKSGKEHTSPILAQKDMFNVFAFSKDATLFASQGEDATVSSSGVYTSWGWEPNEKTRLLILSTGDEIAAFSQDASTVTLSPDNRMLAANTKAINVELWDIKKKKMFAWTADDSIWRKLIFSPDSKLLAAYGARTNTQVWNITTRNEITPSNINQASHLAFSPDSSLLALKHPNGIDLWQITPSRMQKERTIVENTTDSGVLVFSLDAEILVGIRWIDGQIHIQLWDVDTGKGLINFNSGHTNPIETLVFSHNGKILASGSLDGTILLWDWEKVVNKAKENGEN